MRHPSTPTERVVWIARLLAHEGEYGMVTHLSQEIGASRQTLTTWRAMGRARLVADAVDAPGSPACDRHRAVLSLLVAGHASYRGMQACLAELLGASLGLAEIGQIVAEAGKRAQQVLATLVPPAPVVLAVDEAYGGAARHGYLHAVDARSGVVWASAGPVVPSTAAWTHLLSELSTRGVVWSGAVHDGGKAAASAIAALTPTASRQRDIWHVLHRCAQTESRLQRLRDRAEGRWVSAERYEQALAHGKRPLQRPPTGSAIAQAEAVDQLQQVADDVRYLTSDLQRLVDVVVLDRDRVLTTADRHTELTALLALLAERAETAPAPAQPEIVSLHRVVTEVRTGLFVFAAGLDPVQHELAGRIGEAGVALVGWAWQRCAVLGGPERVVAGLPPDWHTPARILITAWSTAVRASSAVEGWHSVLRPHLAVHRTLTPAIQAILAVYHNHHCAPRGQYAGQSPLHRSGLVDADTDWLTVLGYPPPTASRRSTTARRTQPPLAA